MKSNELNIQNRLSTFFWSIFIVFFFVKLAESLCFINYFDPFAYHLAFPKAWYETSFYEAMTDNDLFVIAGVFDYLYMIPMYLTGASPYPAQIIAQTMHFIFSIGGGSLLLVYYFRKYDWAPLAGLSILSISKSATFFMVAKNDGALSLAVLCAFILIFDKDFFSNLQNTKRALLIGILLGLIPAIKLNGVLYAAPLGILYLVLYKRRLTDLLTVILVSLSIFGMVLYKNWFFMKNPLFPALVSKLPGNATEEMITFYSYYMDSSFKWSQAFLHLKYFLMGKVVYLACLISLFVRIKRISKNSYRFNDYFNDNIIIFSCALFSYLFYIFVNGGVPTYRFIFPVYFLLTFYLLKELSANQESLLRFKYFTTILLILILADSKIDKSIKRLISSYKMRDLSSKEVVRRNFPYSQLWDHIKVTDKTKKTYIISDYLSNMYYSPKGVRVQCSLLDRHAGFIHKCPNVLNLKGFDYALLKEQRDNPCYKLIKEHGDLLHTVQNIALYDIRYLFKNKNKSSKATE